MTTRICLRYRNKNGHLNHNKADDHLIIQVTIPKKKSGMGIDNVMDLDSTTNQMNKEDDFFF